MKSEELSLLVFLLSRCLLFVFRRKMYALTRGVPLCLSHSVPDATYFPLTPTTATTAINGGFSKAACLDFRESVGHRPQIDFLSDATSRRRKGRQTHILWSFNVLSLPHMRSHLVIIHWFHSYRDPGVFFISRGDGGAVAVERNGISGESSASLFSNPISTCPVVRACADRILFQAVSYRLYRDSTGGVQLPFVPILRMRTGLNCFILCIFPRSPHPPAPDECDRPKR